MRCPTCHADNPTGSFVCHACLRPLPLTEGGEVPMTVETGAPPSTRFVRQPSEWTTPIQVTAAIQHLLLSAVVSVLALALGQEGFTRAFVLSATARGTNLTIDQLTSTAHVSYEGVPRAHGVGRGAQGAAGSRRVHALELGLHPRHGAAGAVGAEHSWNPAPGPVDRHQRDDPGPGADPRGPGPGLDLPVRLDGGGG